MNRREKAGPGPPYKERDSSFVIVFSKRMGKEKKNPASTEAKGLYNSVTRDMKGKRMMVLEPKAGTGSESSPRSPGSLLFPHLVPSACCLLPP